MFKFYQVGGCVRDKLLGLECKDIDYTAVYNNFTNEDSISNIFEMLVDYLKANQYAIFLTTESCYTIRAKFPKDHINAGLVADFVLARKELGYKPNTREPIVIPGSLYDDLERRDFTCNAIAMDEEGMYIDPFNGTYDIHCRILKTPINGHVTFEDDPLRLLRAIRFAVTKGFSICNDISDIIKNFDYDGKFSVVSEERVREELHKCFKYSTYRTLNYLDDYSNLREYIFTGTKMWLCPTTKL